MKNYLYGGIVSLTVLTLAFVAAGTKTASAHGFVPHFLATGVTEVTSNSAVLTGTVDSMHSSWNGHAWFEYGTGNSWGNKVGVRGLPWIGQTSMSVKVTGLKPNTTYNFHLKAENENGSNTGETMTFRTKGSNHTDSSTQSNNNNNYQSNNQKPVDYTYNNNTTNNVVTTVNYNSWDYTYNTNNYTNYYSNNNTYQTLMNQTTSVYTYHN